MAHPHPSRSAFRSKATTAKPVADALLRDGQAAARAGHHGEAVTLLRRCLEAAPANGEAWTALGRALTHQGDLVGASNAYTTALRHRPRAAINHFGLAEILGRQGEMAQAIASCDTGMALDASPGEGHLVRSALRRSAGDIEGAIADLVLMVKAFPQATAVRGLLIDYLEAASRFPEATQAILEAIALTPGDVVLRERLTRVLLKQGRVEDATRVWEAKLALKPGDAEAFWILAGFYQELGRTQEAFDTYQKAIALDPRMRKAYVSLATLMMDTNRLDLAESIFRFVMTLAPDEPGPPHNLGVVLRLQQKYEEAAAAYRLALAIAPGFPESLTDLFHIQQHFCEWEGLDALRTGLVDSAKQNAKAISPFALLTFLLKPDEHLRNARLEALKVSRGVNAALAAYEPRPVAARNRRPRVGYVSTDFNVHAVASLVVQHLEHHDRSRFEIFGFSIGPNDGSAVRRRVETACEHFVDLSTMGKREAARRIRAEEIDILIDLNGYTQNARVEIFAWRPAPIQINYLGYPGTMGAPFFDYIMVDPIVAPSEHAPWYDEKLVHLPHCYQPNDSARLIDGCLPNRQDCGLPPDGFVFCCINNNYKINATIFDAWMRILIAVPGSVLWLLEANPRIAANLRREAQTRGVDAQRLVFGPRLPAAQHLARLPVADLFLDTLPYNAHTTGSEALWVGLPLLTCMTNCFAGRVAGSLLSAVGLPDMITTSLAAYEAKAIALANDPGAMRRLRESLAATRASAPLFDTPRYTRNFESALTRMMSLRDAGEAPEAFAVTDHG